MVQFNAFFVSVFGASPSNPKIVALKIHYKESIDEKVRICNDTHLYIFNTIYIYIYSVSHALQLSEAVSVPFKLKQDERFVVFAMRLPNKRIN